MYQQKVKLNMNLENFNLFIEEFEFGHGSERGIITIPL